MLNQYQQEAQSQTQSASDAETSERIAQEIQKLSDRIARKRHQSRYILIPLLIVQFVSCLVSLVLLFYGRTLYELRFFALALALLAATFVLLFRFFKSDLGKIELEAFRDVRAVGPLLDALRPPVTNSPAVQNEIFLLLADLLPRLKASDAHLLSDSQRKTLLRCLHPASMFLNGTFIPTEFYVGVLKALEQIGDEKALPAVERLSRMKVRNERGRSIRDAAQECLPFLRARVEQSVPGEDLLRPAVPVSSPAELLRPAQDKTVETPVEELLRVSEK